MSIDVSMDEQFEKARTEAFKTEWNGKKSIEKILWDRATAWAYQWVLENRLNPQNIELEEIAHH